MVSKYYKIAISLFLLLFLYLTFHYFYVSSKKNFIIRTDGENSFELNQNNNIYFYTNTNEQIKIEISGVLKDKEILCYQKDTNNSVKIRLNEFSQFCKSSIFFIGKINDNFFYFRLKQQRENKSKNLLVLPATNFYVYSNNIYNISPYNMKNDYVIKLNDVPFHPSDVWASKTSLSIHNIYNIIKNYDVILDYELQNFQLEDYSLIILPLHQEYVSDEFIESLQNFLKKKDRAILSIGGANFMRDFELKNTNTMIIQKDKLKDVKYYGLNTYDNGSNKNCYFLDDNQLEVGEITEPLLNINIEYFFPKIECEKKKIIPLLSIQSFHNNSNSKLVHILSDGIGINFTKIDYLRSKVLIELNMMLRK